MPCIMTLLSFASADGFWFLATKWQISETVRELGGRFSCTYDELSRNKTKDASSWTYNVNRPAVPVKRSGSSHLLSHLCPVSPPHFNNRKPFILLETGSIARPASVIRMSSCILETHATLQPAARTRATEKRGSRWRPVLFARKNGEIR